MANLSVLRDAGTNNEFAVAPRGAFCESCVKDANMDLREVPKARIPWCLVLFGAWCHVCDVVWIAVDDKMMLKMYV